MCSRCIEVPGVTRRRQWISGTGVIDSCEPSDVCTELNVLQKSNIRPQLLSCLLGPAIFEFWGTHSSYAAWWNWWPWCHWPQRRKQSFIALCLADLSGGKGWGETYIVLLHCNHFTHQLQLLASSEIFKVHLQLKTHIVLWLRLNCSMWMILCKRSGCKNKSGNSQEKRRLEN